MMDDMGNMDSTACKDNMVVLVSDMDTVGVDKVVLVDDNTAAALRLRTLQNLHNQYSPVGLAVRTLLQDVRDDPPK
jgi:hypothetical protein